MAKKNGSVVVDEVPAGASDMGSAELTKEASKAITPWASGAMVEFHPTLAEIANLKEKHEQLLAETDVTTKEGYKVVKSAARNLASLRTAVNSRRLAETKQARDYQARVNAAGNEIIERLEEIEQPLENAITAEDRRQHAAAEAKARQIEEEQRAKEEQRLALIKAEEDRKKAEEQAALKAKEEELAKARAEIEAEKAKFAAQRAQFDKEQAELREAQEKQRLENERAQREAQEKINSERRAKEDAEREEQRKRDAEADRIAYEKKVEEAKKKAADQAIENERARVAREAEAARIKEEKAKAAAAKKAAQAPDKVKIEKWANDIMAGVDDICEVKTAEYKAILNAAINSITAAIGNLKAAVKKASE